MKKWLFVLLGLGIVACAASSQDDAKIRARMDKIIVYAQKDDTVAIMEMMPPDLMPKMAELAGTSLSKLKETVRAQLEELKDVARFEKLDYDMKQAQRGTSSTGRKYMIIPTTTILASDDIRMEEKSHMLAIEEKGQWYFLQMKTPANLKILKMIYPDLEALPNLPSSSKIIPIEPPKE